MLITNQPHTIFPTLAKAQEIASLNNADEVEFGWRYDAVADPSGSGRAIVRVYDEAGIFVANL